MNEHESSPNGFSEVSANRIAAYLNHPQAGGAGLREVNPNELAGVEGGVSPLDVIAALFVLSRPTVPR